MPKLCSKKILTLFENVLDLSTKSVILILCFQSSFHPTCGQMVGFNASNLHGVKAVRRGQRCALAIWFTLDEFFREAGHLDARELLTRRAEKPNRIMDEL